MDFCYAIVGECDQEGSLDGAALPTGVRLAPFWARGIELHKPRNSLVVKTGHSAETVTLPQISK